MYEWIWRFAWGCLSFAIKFLFVFKCAFIGFSLKIELYNLIYYLIEIQIDLKFKYIRNDPMQYVNLFRERSSTTYLHTRAIFSFSDKSAELFLSQNNMYIRYHHVVIHQRFFSRFTETKIQIIRFVSAPKPSQSFFLKPSFFIWSKHPSKISSDSLKAREWSRPVYSIIALDNVPLTRRRKIFYANTFASHNN